MLHRPGGWRTPATGCWAQSWAFIVGGLGQGCDSARVQIQHMQLERAANARDIGQGFTVWADAGRDVVVAAERHALGIAPTDPHFVNLGDSTTIADKVQALPIWAKVASVSMPLFCIKRRGWPPWASIRYSCDKPSRLKVTANWLPSGDHAGHCWSPGNWPQCAAGHWPHRAHTPPACAIQTTHRPAACRWATKRGK